MPSGKSLLICEAGGGEGVLKIKAPQERGPEIYLKEEDEAVVLSGHTHPFPLWSFHPFVWTSLRASRALALGRALEQSTSTQASEDPKDAILVDTIPGISETPPLTSSLNKNPDQ